MWNLSTWIPPLDALKISYCSTSLYRLCVSGPPFVWTRLKEGRIRAIPVFRVTNLQLSNEDDLTMGLMKIIGINTAIEHDLEKVNTLEKSSIVDT